MVDLGARLARVLTRRGDDGALAHADNAVAGFVPLMYLEILRLDPSVEIPDGAKAALAAWLGTGEGLEEKLEQRLKDPEVKALQLEIEAALREALAEAGGDTSALARFAGDQRQVQALEGERPEGTTPAGPLARFQLK